LVKVDYYHRPIVVDDDSIGRIGSGVVIGVTNYQV